MSALQLQLFEEIAPSPYDLERELSKTKEQVNNLRRGLFKRYDEMCKEINLLKDEHAKLLASFPKKRSKRIQ